MRRELSCDKVTALRPAAASLAQSGDQDADQQDDDRDDHEELDERETAARAAGL